MKPQQIRELAPDDLRGKEKELQEQLFRLRFQKSLGQLDNALKLREVRRDIARVKTVLREKSAGER
jgi:large subunit ribosomal protein L29